MQDLIISLNKNVLRVSTVDKEASPKTSMADVPTGVVDDSRIIDSGSLSNILDDLVNRVTDLPKKQLNLNFVVEPQDVFLRYVTVSRTDSQLEEKIISEIKAKDPDLPLDDIFFSYRKKAPFVYQFIGIRKDVMSAYIDVSNSVGVSLKSVIPWVLVLPKYENINDPSIFISKLDGDQVVALSELNGVFFAGSYKEEKTSEELSALIKELSFYKRSSPIKYIFTFGYENFDMPGYSVKKIQPPEFNGYDQTPKGFELNIILKFMLDSDPDLVDSQVNVLNMLPLPVAEKKTSALAVVGPIVGALLLLVGAYFGIKSLGNKDNSKDSLAVNPEQTQVLSESVQQQPAEPDETTQKPIQPDKDPNMEVKKGNLKIRIENGAGVSGLAAKTKEFLTEFGYTILNIDTAESLIEHTILNFKKEMVGDYKDIVYSDMVTKFPNIEVKEDLQEDSDYDLLIIVGTSSEL